jgi:RNA recognition motif-containing protein
MSMYIGNLSYQVIAEELSSVLAEYSTVKRIQIPTHRETGRSREFGFVEMGADAEQKTAIQECDGLQ